MSTATNIPEPVQPASVPEPVQRTVPVVTPSKSYEVIIGRGVLDHAGDVIKALLGDVRTCIVADRIVADLYAERLACALQRSGLVTSLVSFPAGEQHKTFTVLAHMLEDIAAARLSRGDCIVALGGGVTGDMAGLAAALYLRGCHVVQIPTSLLAMVDSSVGGKTAVNLAAGKNLAGAFMQPEAVIADIDLLTSISPDLFRDSCGEMIKHGVLADEALFERLSCAPVSADPQHLDELVDIVARNVEIKRDVVAADEREHGLRQSLNLGHTIGHAIEAASNYHLGHGSSVAAGLCCMARACAHRGWCANEVPARIEACCTTYGLPTSTEVSPRELMRYLMHDKKRSSQGFNIVVPVRIGATEIKFVSYDTMYELVCAGCTSTGADSASCTTSKEHNG